MYSVLLWCIRATIHRSQALCRQMSTTSVMLTTISNFRPSLLPLPRLPFPPPSPQLHNIKRRKLNKIPCTSPTHVQSRKPLPHPPRSSHQGYALCYPHFASSSPSRFRVQRSPNCLLRRLTQRPCSQAEIEIDRRSRVLGEPRTASRLHHMPF